MDDQNSNNAAQNPSGEALESPLPAHVWAFDIEDRGYRVRASYQDELGGNVEIYHGSNLFRTLTYEGYRIWNIAAHFRDWVDEWLAEADSQWREVDAVIQRPVASA